MLLPSWGGQKMLILLSLLQPLNAADVVINEVLVDAVGTDAGQEWIELYNASGRATSLLGFELFGDDGDSHVIQVDIEVGPGERLVLGRNADFATNGAITTDYEYSGFGLDNVSDVVGLRFEGVLVDRVEYDLSVEWSGAAGADQRVHTVLVDLTAGRVLEPLDVFYDDSPWLETLASVALADLEARFGVDTIWPDGLAATPGNFDHLALAGDGVVLWFDRYQVGPGVLGAPRVTVPWSEVGEFVDPNGPVGHLVAAAG